MTRAPRLAATAVALTLAVTGCSSGGGGAAGTSAPGKPAQSTGLDAAAWSAALDAVAKDCGFSQTVAVESRDGSLSVLGPDAQQACNYYFDSKSVEKNPAGTFRVDYTAPSVVLSLADVKAIDPAKIGQAISSSGAGVQNWKIVKYQGWDKPYAVSSSPNVYWAANTDGTPVPARTFSADDLTAQWSLAQAALAQDNGKAVYVSGGSVEKSFRLSF
jgi:hypothetical protein